MLLFLTLLWNENLQLQLATILLQAGIISDIKALREVVEGLNVPIVLAIVIYALVYCIRWLIRYFETRDKEVKKELTERIAKLENDLEEQRKMNSGLLQSQNESYYKLLGVNSKALEQIDLLARTTLLNVEARSLENQRTLEEYSELLHDFARKLNVKLTSKPKP